MNFPGFSSLFKVLPFTLSFYIEKRFSTCYNFYNKDLRKISFSKSLLELGIIGGIDNGEEDEKTLIDNVAYCFVLDYTCSYNECL